MSHKGTSTGGLRLYWKHGKTTGSTGYHPQNRQLRQQDNVRSSTHLYGWAQKVGHSSNSFWFRKSSPALMFLFKYPFLSSPHHLIGPSHPAFVCWQEIWVWKPKSTWDSIEVLLDSRSLGRSGIFSTAVVDLWVARVRKQAQGCDRGRETRILKGAETSPRGDRRGSNYFVQGTLCPSCPALIP